jgi:hypothetical protein
MQRALIGFFLLAGCAEATAPVDRGCGEPTDTPSAIAYTRCLERAR